MLHSVNAHFPSIGATETSFSLHVSATSLRACLDAHVSTSGLVRFNFNPCGLDGIKSV